MKLFPLWNREDKSPGGVAKCLFCSIWDRNAGLSDDSFALAQCKILVLVIFLTYVLFQLVKRVCGLEFGREDYRCKTGDHDKDEEEAVDDILFGLHELEEEQEEGEVQRTETIGRVLRRTELAQLEQLLTRRPCLLLHQQHQQYLRLQVKDRQVKDRILNTK